MMRHNGEEGSFLRVAVNGGGCSGFTYGMGFETEKSEKDQLLEQHGLQILVSNDDVDILKGTQVDYKESLMGGGFTIENPNAIAIMWLWNFIQNSEESWNTSRLLIDYCPPNIYT